MENIDPTFEFEVINIKLQTNKTPEERYESYKSIILDLVKSQLHSAVGLNKHLIIYSATLKVSDTGIEYIYGRIGKGIYFDKENGSSIDIKKSSTESEIFDITKIYNPDKADYIFIPSAHRFCVKMGDKISGNEVRKFLYVNIPFVMDTSDKIQVEIENEEKAIQEILTALKIHKIDYIISYTNDDTLGAAASLFEKRLKKSQIGKINIKAEADHHDFMKFKGEEILEGGIELAENNGNINSAEITNSKGIRKTVTTKDKPKRIKIQCDYEIFRNVIVSTIMSLYRNNI